MFQLFFLAKDEANIIMFIFIFGTKSTLPEICTCCHMYLENSHWLPSVTHKNKHSCQTNIRSLVFM